MIKNVERLEGNMAVITIEEDADKLSKALDKVYAENRDKFTVDGFRPGQAPRSVVEKKYGKVFLEEAAGAVVQEAYANVLMSGEGKAIGIKSRPELEVVQAEEGKPLIFTATVALEPEVRLGEYKNIDVPSKTAEVTDDDIEAAKEDLRQKNKEEVRMLQRPAQTGDVVTIDFEGYIGGVVFDGGHGEDFQLELGSHSFIDTFEEQLVGHKAGEQVNVKVAFPLNYQAEELAGKDAVFQVTIKEVTGFDVPDFDIALITVATEFDSIEDFIEDARKKILESKQEQLDIERENEILARIIEDSEIKVPQPMIDMRAEEMFDAYARQLRSQGLELSEYFEFMGMNNGSEFLASLRPEAEQYIKSRCVLKAIANAEGIEVSDDELKAEIEAMAGQYRTTVKQIEDMMDETNRELIIEDLLIQKTMKSLIK